MNKPLCTYCNDSGIIRVLQNPICHLDGFDEPFYEEQPCEECGIEEHENREKYLNDSLLVSSKKLAEISGDIGFHLGRYHNIPHIKILEQDKILSEVSRIIELIEELKKE